MLADCDVTETRDMTNTGTVFLDPDQKSPRAQDFEERLTARIVGQERAVRRISKAQSLRCRRPRRRGANSFDGKTGA